MTECNLPSAKDVVSALGVDVAKLIAIYQWLSVDAAQSLSTEKKAEVFDVIERTQARLTQLRVLIADDHLSSK